MNTNGTSGEDSRRKWGALLETGGKTIFLYSGKKYLAELYPIVVWNAEFISDELGYLAKALSKKHVEGMAWFLLAAYNKMQEER